MFFFIWSVCPSLNYGFLLPLWYLQTFSCIECTSQYNYDPHPPVHRHNQYIHGKSYTGYKLYHWVCPSYMDVGFYVREDVNFVDEESKVSIGSRTESDVSLKLVIWLCKWLFKRILFNLTTNDRHVMFRGVASLHMIHSKHMVSPVNYCCNSPSCSGLYGFRYCSVTFNILCNGVILIIADMIYKYNHFKSI